MNWHYIGVGMFALVVAFVLWKRSGKIARNNNALSRFLFRGLAPDIDPDAPKASALIVAGVGVALIVLGCLGIWL